LNLATFQPASLSTMITPSGAYPFVVHVAQLVAKQIIPIPHNHLHFRIR
jgi:hypothetical protein